MKNFKQLIYLILLNSMFCNAQLNLTSFDYYVNPSVLNPSEMSSNYTLSSLGVKLKPNNSSRYNGYVTTPINKNISVGGGVYIDNNHKDISQNYTYINASYRFDVNETTDIKIGLKGSYLSLSNGYKKENFGIGVSFVSKIKGKEFEFNLAVPSILKTQIIGEWNGYNYILEEKGLWGVFSQQIKVIDKEKYDLIIRSDLNFLNQFRDKDVMQPYHSTGCFSFKYNRKNKYNILTYIKYSDKIGISSDIKVLNSLNIGVDYSYSYYKNTLNNPNNLTLFLKYNFQYEK